MKLLKTLLEGFRLTVQFFCLAVYLIALVAVALLMSPLAALNRFSEWIFKDIDLDF